MKCPYFGMVEYLAENVKSDPHRYPVTKVIHLTHHSSLPDCVSYQQFTMCGHSTVRFLKNMRTCKFCLELRFVHGVYVTICKLCLSSVYIVLPKIVKVDLNWYAFQVSTNADHLKRGF